MRGVLYIAHTTHVTLPFFFFWLNILGSKYTLRKTCVGACRSLPGPQWGPVEQCHGLASGLKGGEFKIL